MSKFLLMITMIILLCVGTSFATTEMVAGLPLHIQKFDSGAIRVWIGDHISSTATVAIPTSEGLVIIDTTGNPTVDHELRQVIARELGRDDFKFLINTHEHRDHTGGNAVYADCTIVGHELVAEGMNRSPEQQQRTIDWLTRRIAELETLSEQPAAENPDLPQHKEDLILKRLELTVAQDKGADYPPTKTFSDEMKLKVGDTVFEMYYIGGMHTASDIAILVPKHGLMMTGDTMADVWLTNTPGCLASFIARPGIRHDFPLLLANWNTLLTRKDDIKTLVTGHWNGELSFAGFENRVKYIEALWEATKQADVAGNGVDEMLISYQLADRFPELVNSPGCSQGNNLTTIMEMWTMVSDQRSGSAALYDLIDSGADEAEIRQVLAQRDAEKPTHFFLETRINGYGYRFLQTEKTEQAVKMFRINVKLFPESWNVYDSLGEALVAMGNNDEAIAMYEKSLVLNPESPTGLEMLERIRSGATVN